MLWFESFKVLVRFLSRRIDRFVELPGVRPRPLTISEVLEECFQ